MVARMWTGNAEQTAIRKQLVAPDGGREEDEVKGLMKVTIHMAMVYGRTDNDTLSGH